MPTTTNIYVLRLQGGAYYVGKSDDPMRRYQEHLEGRGSAWTKLHRPIAVERVIAGASPFDEDKITKELMAKHGVDKVRGGAYVSIDLDEVQEEALQREIWASTDKCTQCGRPGHFAASCCASTGFVKKKEVICYRCGAPGHYAPECNSNNKHIARYSYNDTNNIQKYSSISITAKKNITEEYSEGDEEDEEEYEYYDEGSEEEDEYDEEDSEEDEYDEEYPEEYEYDNDDCY